MDGSLWCSVVICPATLPSQQEKEEISLKAICLG